jgi:exodeoxyribonuclease VIII
MQLDPDRPAPSEPTPALKNGALVHCCVFEPDQVALRYVVKPAGLDLRTKEGKAWREAQTLEIVDAEAMALAAGQARAMRSLPEVAALLSDGVGEASAFWIDEKTGELCKCRPDWTSPVGDGVILVDGKTTIDASLAGFSRAIWNFDYHLQAAWYSDGYEAATGKHVHGFVFAAAESSWPHVAAAYMLDDQVLDRARAENRRLLDLYAECRRTNHWPGYQTGIQPITLPSWAMKEIA